MKKFTILFAMLISFSVVFGQVDVRPNFIPKPIPSNNQNAIKASWQLEFNYPTSYLLTGVECDGSYYYTSFWQTAWFYRYDMTGAFVDSFSITGVSAVRDLAYDGTYFYGSAASNNIFQMNFTTRTLVSTITAPTGTAARHIAYDPGNDAFWCGNFSSDFSLVTKTGTIINTISATNHGLSGCYGSAFDTLSTGGPYLWIFSQDGNGTDIVQIDLATGLPTPNYHDCTTDITVAGSLAGGMCIYVDTASGDHILCGAIQNERIFGYNLNALQAVDYDMSVTACDLNTLESVGNLTVSGDITNLGDSTITSYTLNYSVDGGSAVTDNITGVNMPLNSTISFSHSTPWAATSGQHELKIWATNLNGSIADMDNGNDTLTMLIDVVDSTTQRTVLMEPFTNTSCGPCATYGPDFRTLLLNNISKVAVIYYHFDYPGPNDPFYLFTPDNEARCQYYSINSVPHTKMDGNVFGDHIAYLTAADINNRYNTPALYEIDITATPSGTDDLDIDVDVTALLSTAASGVKLRVAIIEDEINLASAPGSNGEKDFYWTFRDMLPSAAGATAGPFTQYTPKNFNYTYTYQTGTPAVDKNQVKVVAFLQDDNTKEVLQAAVVDYFPYVGIDEDYAGVAFGMYPNPVNNTLYMKYQIQAEENITINVYNLLGSLMLTEAHGTQQSGDYTVSLNVSDLPQGVYLVELQTANTKIVRKLIVE